MLLHYFTYFIFFFILLHEGSDIPDQTLFPCASCTELVNSDMKCSLCEKPMHVFCSAVELEDGVGDAVCKLCLELPCAVCQKLVNGDYKCERCYRNMHASCCAFPTTDGGRTTMCLDCTYVTQSEADDIEDEANDRELLSIRLFVCSFVRLFVCSFVRRSFICSFVRLFVCLFVRLFVCLFVCFFLSFFLC